MTNEKAIALVNDAFSGYYCDWEGTFTETEKDELAEANRMVIKALEQAPTINGNTLTIKVSEEDIDKARRVMLDCAPWCRVFYEDAKDTNVPSKEIIYCKDCKHYRAYAGRLDGYCYKAEWYNRYQNEDDFCSRGER